MSGKEAVRLKTLISTLDKTHRLILMLFYVDRLTPTEIGVVLDLPEPHIQDILDTVRCRARDQVAADPALQTAALN